MIASRPTSEIVLGMTLAIFAGFGIGRHSVSDTQAAGPGPAATLSGIVQHHDSVADAIELNEAAMSILINAGHSDDTQAMLINPLSKNECIDRLNELQTNGITPAFKEFSDELVLSADHWYLLMKSALGRSGHLRSHGDRENEASILDALTRIAQANCAEDRPELSRQLAENFLKEIETVKRMRRHYDP